MFPYPANTSSMGQFWVKWIGPEHCSGGFPQHYSWRRFTFGNATMYRMYGPSVKRIAFISCCIFQACQKDMIHVCGVIPTLMVKLPVKLKPIFHQTFSLSCVGNKAQRKWNVYVKPIFHWKLGLRWPPKANEINTKKIKCTLPTRTYIPLTCVGG